MMGIFGRHAGVERALREAAPHDLIPTARAVLVERVGAQDAVLLLADYGLTVLQPVITLPRTEGALRIAEATCGRAFSEQTPVVARADEAVVVHAPVTVRGDRLGVLSVSFPGADVSRELVGELAEFATLLGHELLIADRETDLFQQARRRKRLTLAAEMQWQLLPGTGCGREEFTLGGHLEPAYAVGGDNFDWSTSADQLILTVTDGMGQGVDASLLTGLAVNAMRNARRAGLDVVDQASLADQAVYAQYGGAAYASTLLLRFDLATGRVSAVDAGSPHVYRHRKGRVDRVELTAQMPLGMFEDTPYEEQSFQLEPGDRLIVVSSGVHGARASDGTEFGRGALHDGIHAAGSARPYETARAVVGSLFDHVGGGELDADAAVVCLDWRGRGDAPRR
jgi:serine phosphatase RsbU (regulator of sigma subunit)